jgi:hypothetical protein
MTSLVSIYARRAFCVFNHPNHKGEHHEQRNPRTTFGPEQIKQREGNFGKILDYVEAHSIIQRLNDAFDGEWSFTMTKYEIMKETDEVIVIGQLNAGGIVKSQFGSSRITRAKETGDIISLADDLKAATTDALKKAATLLGVGLHLYRNERPQGGNRNGDSLPTEETVTVAMVPARTVAEATAMGMVTVAPTGQRVTAATVPLSTVEPATAIPTVMVTAVSPRNSTSTS